MGLVLGCTHTLTPSLKADASVQVGRGALLSPHGLNGMGHSVTPLPRQAVLHPSMDILEAGGEAGTPCPFLSRSPTDSSSTRTAFLSGPPFHHLVPWSQFLPGCCSTPVPDNRKPLPSPKGSFKVKATKGWRCLCPQTSLWCRGSAGTGPWAPREVAQLQAWHCCWNCLLFPITVLRTVPMARLWDWVCDH